MMYLNEKFNRETMRAFEEFQYKLESFRIEQLKKEYENQKDDFEM